MLEHMPSDASAEQALRHAALVSAMTPAQRVYGWVPDDVIG